jgi:hypothetical protein
VTDRLTEVPESEALGGIAETYADIRRVLQLPVVSLVYRHLATRPGLLEEIWAALRPNFASAAAGAAAAELVAAAAPPHVMPIPRSALAAAGLEAGRADLAAATLRAYERANSRNLLGMHVLLDGCPGTGSDAATAPEMEVPAILPMASVDSLPPPSSRLLDEMSLYLTGAERPLLVPSLLRHFAAEPCLLALIWTVLGPAVTGGEVTARADAVAARARTLAPRLPYPVAPLEHARARDVARRFVPTMSRMLVLGEMLKTALAEAL